MKSKAIVEDLTEYVNRGITPRYTEALENSLPVINQRCIRDFHVNMELVRLNDLSKRKITEGKTLQKNDVLINSTGVGTLGRVAQFYGESGSATVDSHVTIVRPKAELVDPIYFGYLLKSKQRLIESFAAGTTGQTELARDSVKEMVLEYVSDIEKQKVIGNFFLVLDEKIQLNHQINQTLEQIAQALFKSWFVDFDPVKAKIDVLEAGGSEEEALLAAMQVVSSKNAEELAAFEVEKPEEYAELRATAELFPAAMVESELGEIPEGWEVRSLLELVELIGGGTPKRSESEYWDGDLYWFSIKDLPAFGNVFVIDTEEKITEAGLKGSSTKILPLGTTIITARGTVGKLALTGVSTAMNQSCYGVVGKNGTGPYLNYLRLSNAIEALERNVHGAVFDTITRNTFATVMKVQATLEIRQSFETLITPLFESIKSKLFQSKALSEMRDVLLPKLLSGKLSVEKIREEKELESIHE